MSELQGQFVWHELATTDVNRAVAFYEDVVGWRTQAFDDNYRLWLAEGTGLGGVTALGEPQKRAGASPHWLAYVGADDVDALTKEAESLGATTRVAPGDIPTVGRFSVIADPQGAVIALFKPQPREETRPAQPAHGYVSWNELMTDDPEAALRFYGGLFGWQKTDAVESPMGIYQMYGKGGRTFGGIAKRPKDFPAPPHWLYYVNVADLDGALARVKKGGGQVMHGPMAIPGGERVAQCLDPQRAAFALHGK